MGAEQSSQESTKVKSPSKSRSPSPKRVQSVAPRKMSNKSTELNNPLTELFTRPEHRDVLSVINKELGPKDRRTMGLLSKTIYDNLGGKVQAKKDYKEINSLTDDEKDYARELIKFLFKSKYDGIPFVGDLMQGFQKAYKNDQGESEDSMKILKRMLKKVDWHQTLEQKKAVFKDW